MPARSEGPLREIAWSQLFPWLLIFRTFRPAISVSIMVPAVVAVLLMPLGWRMGRVLLPEDQETEEIVAHATPPWDHGPQAAVPGGGSFLRSLQQLVVDAPLKLEQTFHALSRPFRRCFAAELSLHEFAYYVFGAVWTAAVAALCAGPITRVALLRLGRHERVGLQVAVRFCLRRYLSYFGAPFFPFLAIVLFGLFAAAVGLLLRPAFAAPLASLAWPLVLLGAAGSAVLLLGLLFGWPLMWPTISGEPAGDVFEAFQRSFSYTFERPLQYLYYALLASIFGALSWALVYLFTEGVIYLAFWGTSWGASSERLAEIVAEEGSNAEVAAANIIGFFNGIVRTLATAFLYAFFWCAASAVYLLLRRDVDRAEFDEVFVEEPVGDGLPPLENDASGIPQPASKAEPTSTPSEPDSEGEPEEAAEDDQDARPSDPTGRDDAGEEKPSP